ncbi:MAG: carbohydrate binding family 9 domain-containing protein [Tannerellaceae bacterium]|jgi:hypothetical protein|nr:carbohydrate binding family 9 domain-containing protein [Tannerellaceae bacterium]
MKKTFLLLLCLSSVFYSYSQEAEVIPFEDAYKRVYNIIKVTDDNLPVIDGQLDEDFWSRGEWSAPFAQVSPFERQLSDSPTYVKVLYDNRFIYVAVYCKDKEPEKMNRFIDNRDENNVGDLVSIAFDTYHDFRAAPEFNLNLGGNKTDLIVTDKREINRSWNAVWEARTHVDMADSSWTAEMRIPFSQLRYNQLSADGVWGLHVRRIIRRNGEIQNWSLIPLKNNGHVFSFGEMHGMDDLPKPKGFEIQPYVMGTYRNDPGIPNSPYQKGSSLSGNFGLDAKAALSDYTLDLTVNPDFGQVELDPSVMNLTAYETFYDEKRPFFLEGKHILDFNNGEDMMFYTRRIGATPTYTPAGIDNETSFAETAQNVPIIGALKLTGTNKRGLTIGFVESLTANTSLDVTRGGVQARETVEPLTNYMVARVQKNWKGNILLGGMLTSVNRKLESPHLEKLMVKNAYTAGIDYVQYFNNRLYYIEAKGMYSYMGGSKEAINALQRNAVHYYQRKSGSSYLGVDPNRTSLSGTGGYVKAGRKGNARWTFSETLGWSSPGFDLNAIGYLKETDYYLNETELAFNQTEPWKTFRSNRLSLVQANRWNYGGKAISNSLILTWESMLWNRFQINFKETWGMNSLGRKLRGGPEYRTSPFFVTDVTLNTDKSKRAVFTLNYIYDYNLNKVNIFHTVAPGIALRLGNHLLLSGEFLYDYRPEDTQYVATFIPASPNARHINPNDMPFEDATYLLGHIDQHTYGVTLKAKVNVTPDISIRFYASPYTSTGKYTGYKVITNPAARNYNDRFHLLAPEEITYADGNYSVNYNGRQYRFADPDFSFNEFRSNLVARWEYRPGSTLYLVWEHTMSNRDTYVMSGWGDNMNRMFGLPAKNVFMVKLNYWFNL